MPPGGRRLPPPSPPDLQAGRACTPCPPVEALPCPWPAPGGTRLVINTKRLSSSLRGKESRSREEEGGPQGQSSTRGGAGSGAGRVQHPSTRKQKGGSWRLLVRNLPAPQFSSHGSPVPPRAFGTSRWGRKVPTEEQGRPWGEAEGTGLGGPRTRPDAPLPTSEQAAVGGPGRVQ